MDVVGDDRAYTRCAHGRESPSCGVASLGVRLVAGAIALSTAIVCPTTCDAATDDVKDEVPGTPPRGTMWIITESEKLLVDEECVLATEGGVPALPAVEGVLTYDVQSPLPEWGVAVACDPLVGTTGCLDAARISVSFPAIAGEFIPIAESPVVARGSGPLPAEGLWLRVRVTPSWTDPPGLYQGMLRLNPVIPETEEPGGSIRGGFALPVEVAVGGMTAVATSGLEFHLEGGPGPGWYLLEPDLGVVVASNEPEWRLFVEGTAFTSEGAEIALERAEWSELGPDGEPDVWTPLGESNVIMSSEGQLGVFSAAFRLGLEVTPADPAGEYVCHLMLVASPG